MFGIYLFVLSCLFMLAGRSSLLLQLTSRGTVAGLARRATGYIRCPALEAEHGVLDSLAQALAKFLFKISKISFRLPSALRESGLIVSGFFVFWV